MNGPDLCDLAIPVSPASVPLKPRSISLNPGKTVKKIRRPVEKSPCPPAFGLNILWISAASP